MQPMVLLINEELIQLAAENAGGREMVPNCQPFMGITLASGNWWTRGHSYFGPAGAGGGGGRGAASSGLNPALSPQLQSTLKGNTSTRPLRGIQGELLGDNITAQLLPLSHRVPFLGLLQWWVPKSAL